MKKLLFVCTGNTCRSSMAEALFKQLQSRAEALGKIQVISAGTGAVKGEKASPQAIEVMNERGISLKGHRSTPLTKKLIDESDLILTMTTNHKKQVLELAPQARGKVFTLREYVEGGEGIDTVLDEMNHIYQIIDQRKKAFLEVNEKRLMELKDRRRELIRQLEAIDNEVNCLEADFREEIKDLEAQLVNLKSRIPQLDIQDPFGQPVQVYRQCAVEIEEMIKKLINKLDE